VSALREHPIRRYSEVFGLGAERQGFVVEVDFQVTFSFLVVEMEDCRPVAYLGYGRHGHGWRNLFQSGGAQVHVK